MINLSIMDINLCIWEIAMENDDLMMMALSLCYCLDVISNKQTKLMLIEI